jgi:dihydrofolate synthase/folylpolyglutamate synthase
MTQQEAIDYIEHYTWSVTKLGLERTRALLAAMGDPQKELKFIHVAGSNGKGSTCAMLESVLRQAGYRTGLYISPHIQDFRERMQVNGENIPGETLAAITDEVRQVADKMEDHPSQFELVTAIALTYFRRAGCDIVVLEVGLGGALDSTNAIDAPEVAVITNIGLEHTEYLGHTLGEIAAAKGGIIKPGCQVACYDCAPEVLSVIGNICKEKEVPLHRVDMSQITPLDHSLEGQTFLWRDRQLDLPLLGRHQLHNVAVVLETVEVLRERGWQISPEAVEDGLAQVKWPARFEVLNREPLFLLDGGHNPQCAQALAANLEDYLPGEKLTFLLGILGDKDYGAMLDLLCPYAGYVVCVTPDSPRALPAQALAEEVARRGLPVTVCDSLEKAIVASLDRGRPVMAFGSLYLAGSVRTAFRAGYRKWVRKTGIRGRDSLSVEEREKRSQRIVEQILASPEFQRAKTVLLYRATRSEVGLDALTSAPECKDKRLVYPLCISNSEMIALLPEGEDAWVPGYCGISEPVPEKSQTIDPAELDMVLCPCTVFDESCHRMGMGAGFYDRYLPRCTNAAIASVAFEAQKVSQVPTDPWDQPMEMTFTEKATYRRK